MPLYAVTLQFLFNGTKGPNMLQYDKAPVHKVRLIKTWFADVSVKKLQGPAQSPDRNTTEHLWDELKCRLHPSLPDINGVNPHSHAP